MKVPYTNRELSWLDFNQRVLEESKREDLPVLERLKFLAISASNLDEFFQVRIGGLSEEHLKGESSPDPSGMSVSEQLFEARKRAVEMMKQQYDFLKGTLLPKLEEEGIKLKTPSELTGKQLQDLKDRGMKEILPLLTPIAIQYEEASLSLPALQLCLICQLQSAGEGGRHALVTVPWNLPRFLFLEETPEEVEIILIEEVITFLLPELFPEEEIISCEVFRLTKNTDIVVDDQDAINLPGEMKEVLNKRRFGQAVRVELSAGFSEEPRDVILQITGAEKEHLIELTGPLGLHQFFKLATMPGFEEKKFTPWKSQPSPLVPEEQSIFTTLEEKNVLLFHPYESFNPVVKLIEEAAVDSETLAIKQVLYRTASESRIVEALKKAAMNGKQVTVLIEIKARFDEERNLHRADELTKAGVQIIYGVKGYKTHAKATLIIRKTSSGIKRYVHLGTGNYNETTANLYTDISYLSSNNQLGSDTSLFFNMLTGHSKLTRFHKLCPAPILMKKTLLSLIKKERKLAEQGQEGKIMAKMNSLQDPDIIKALYKASQAGVEILLNVRGICCLKPGIKDVSENIRVVSIIDRYLEHTRAFYFEHAGEEKVFISSADWMVRNLEKRLELMIPIDKDSDKKRIIDYLKACFKDNTNAYQILEDGTSEKVTRPKKAFRFQEHLYQQAKKQSDRAEMEDVTTFSPQRTKED